MEAVVLIGGFLSVAVAGYFAMGRFDRFLRKGGISPYWDEAEERQARDTEKEPANTDFSGALEGCNAPHSKVV